MPADYNTAYTGILNAVNDGTITEERINESVTRIVKAKLAMGSRKSCLYFAVIMVQ